MKFKKKWGVWLLELFNSITNLFIGGGHDIAYAQYLATRHIYPDASIGIINIDSHFETRADVQSNSGTMFRQILEKDDNIDYLVLGLSQGRNTRSLYEYAEEKGIIYVYADEILNDLSPTIKDKIERFIHQHETIMFTISMDAIDSAFAPGVSEPTVLGLNPHSVFDIGKRVILSEKRLLLVLLKLIQIMISIIVLLNLQRILFTIL